MRAHAVEAGAPGVLGDQVSDPLRPERPAADAPEEAVVGRGGADGQVDGERAPRVGVERYLPVLAALARPDRQRPLALADRDVAEPERAQLPDADPGVAEQLEDG
ncbi:MAG TPA: hypothetical protein VGM69_25475 [Chloroflexota bacterium]